jgi:hypothetical protein
MVRRRPGLSPGRRLLLRVLAGAVSVSWATRGHSDMRGLVTAGRFFGRSGTACLGSSVTRKGRAAHRCVAGRSSRCHRAVAIAKQLGSFVHHGQRPAPAGQFPGDSNIRDRGAFAAFDEPNPPVMQVSVPKIAASSGRRGSVLPTTLHHSADVVASAVVPSRFDE